MGSRSKRLIQLAIGAESAGIPIRVVSTENDATLNLENTISNTEDATPTIDIIKNATDNAAAQKVISTVSYRPRCDSTSSTSSSSSGSSSSSTSFVEDSDDSVKDPNYEDVASRLHKLSSTDSDSSDEKLNSIVNKDYQMMIPTYSIQEPDLYSIPIEPSSVDTVRTTEEESINPDVSAAQKESIHPDCSPIKTGRKRQRREGSWKKKLVKRQRNSGETYQSLNTKKIIPERQLKPPCEEKCTFKCRSNISEQQRQQLLKQYWSLGEIEKQWLFIANSVETVNPKHRYVKIDSDGNVAPTRDNNSAFYLTVSGIKTRVCKLFFKNTLAITNRPIETALKKKNKESNISAMRDNRGCHENRYRVDECIKNGVKSFIEAIPKIESHYIRANSKRQYIDGSKAITDLHRDYVEQCKSQNQPFATYLMFYRIFTQDFNLSFFVPKKDLCDVCEAFKNSTEEEKEQKKQSYETHQKEKVLSRAEKENDKKNNDLLVAVYDLQAVFQCPKGEISVFYYKSKLNVLNFTIYNIQNNYVENYIWEESNANRGVNEIGTCVFKYLMKVSETATDLNVVFYSDNCAGQQKNKFMLCMYLYAVRTITNLNSITHKYLIKGHTQNEGDSAHSQIEREVKRQLRSGPMFTPDAFIGAVKAARKKSEPFHVHEMCYADFYDLKSLCNQMNFSLTKDEDNNPVKLGELKVIRVQKSDPDAVFIKSSYADTQFKKAVVFRKKKNIGLELKNAYNEKPGLSAKKKADLMDLVNKNLIPRYHRAFYESL